MLTGSPILLFICVSHSMARFQLRSFIGLDSSSLRTTFTWSTNTFKTMKLTARWCTSYEASHTLSLRAWRWTSTLVLFLYLSQLNLRRFISTMHRISRILLNRQAGPGDVCVVLWFMATSSISSIKLAQWTSQMSLRILTLQLLNPGGFSRRKRKEGRTVSNEFCGPCIRSMTALMTTLADLSLNIRLSLRASCSKRLVAWDNPRFLRASYSLTYYSQVTIRQPSNKSAKWSTTKTAKFIWSLITSRERSFHFWP